MAEPQSEEIENVKTSSVDRFTVEILLPHGQSVILADLSPEEQFSNIKSALAENLRSSHYTHYSLVLGHGTDGAVKVVNDFAEIGTYFSEPVTTMSLVAEDYDLKKARAHVTRTRDVIMAPPLHDLLYGTYSEAPANHNYAKLLPQDNICGQFTFSSFFEESLLRTGSVQTPEMQGLKLPRDCVKSVTLSGWNPPPPERRMQGDLVYVEVTTATDGIIHITATAMGFYVNKSTRFLFDPSPAPAANFAHELLDTLKATSPSFEACWKQLSIANPPEVANNGPLGVCVGALLQGVGDQYFSTPQWTHITSSAVQSLLHRSESGRAATSAASVEQQQQQQKQSHVKHTYDVSRCTDDLCDGYGADEAAAPREWNEEIQSMRALPINKINEKVLQARFTHKIVSEFTEACKRAVVAISDGLIAPLNNMTSDAAVVSAEAANGASSVYLYNGIFFSRTIDTMDTFKLCSGDDAFGKSAAHDLANQKLIHAQGVPGLSTTLCCIVDYKGDRYVGQTVLPGVFSVGENTARLMYGTLEPGKRITVKNASLALMKTLGDKLLLKSRNLMAMPLAGKTPSAAVTAAGEDAAKSTSSGFMEAIIESDQTPSVRIDTDDEAVAEDSETVPFIGPLEAKLLRGTDGRIYPLEVMRLTPRDANYVKGDKGTGKLPADMLAHVDNELAKVFIIRQETVSSFIQHKLSKSKQEIMVQMAKMYKEKAETAAGAASDSASAPVDASAAVAVTDDNATINAAAAAAEVASQQERDAYIARLCAITPESLGLELNPNVFFDEIVCDVDSAVVAQDEQTARELAMFIWDVSLPTLTHQVRTGELTPLDGLEMVRILHNLGINMRYLGQLARLAAQQEEEDKALTLLGKLRIQTMPTYWLEFLECEMIARGVKHLMSGYFRQHRAIQSAPAATLVSMLNNIFGGADVEGSTSVEADTNSASAKSADKTKKNKKTKPKQIALAASAITTSAEPQLPVLGNPASQRDACRAELERIVLTRYCYKLSMVSSAAAAAAVLDSNAVAAPATTAAVPALPSSSSPSSYLSFRISRFTLLRRVCQELGLRIATKDYDFTSQCPFSVEDIISLLPKVKTCEPDTLLPEISSLVSTARECLQQGKMDEAFDIAQEAHSWINQVTGPVHKEFLGALDQLTAILLSAGDFKSAFATSTKSLCLAVQLFGLDSQEALYRHVQLSVLHCELKNFEESIQHMMTAKYLVQLLGGARHPELANVLMQLAVVCREVGQLDVGVRCLVEARSLVHDIAKFCVLTDSLAELCLANGDLDDAVNEQRTCHRFALELYGETHSQCQDAKNKLERYLRALTERNVVREKSRRAQLEVAASNAQSSPVNVNDASPRSIEFLDSEDFHDKRQSNSNKKSSSGKKKSKSGKAKK